MHNNINESVRAFPYLHTGNAFIYGYWSNYWSKSLSHKIYFAMRPEQYDGASVNGRKKYSNFFSKPFFK